MPRTSTANESIKKKRMAEELETDINGGKISKHLQSWYMANNRDLPWRESRDPYIIWISEVILQQTKVDQGIAYFHRFTERFPDVESLAEADEQEVLKLWQGLGYYSRARNLHKAARQIMQSFNGQLPKTYRELIRLSGVGEYTAAAIASIAYDLPHAVVDGNVYRVLSRLFEIETPIDTSHGKKQFAEIAEQLLDHANPSIHNQAMMELGALVCTPKNANCELCPLQTSCMAYKYGTTYDFPKKKKKTVTQNRYLNYFNVIQGDFVFIKKRTDADIWRNLYDFPLVETSCPVEIDDLSQNIDFQNLFQNNDKIDFVHTTRIKHILTHRILFVNFYQVSLQETANFNEEGKFLKIKLAELHNYPVSGLIGKYLARFPLKGL